MQEIIIRLWQKSGNFNNLQSKIDVHFEKKSQVHRQEVLLWVFKLLFKASLVFHTITLATFSKCNTQGVKKDWKFARLFLFCQDHYSQGYFTRDELLVVIAFGGVALLWGLTFGGVALLWELPTFPQASVESLKQGEHNSLIVHVPTRKSISREKQLILHYRNKQGSMTTWMTLS